jgi:hypothetical protein
MNEVQKALTLFLLRQDCPPRICYTCENRGWEKHSRWYSPNGLGYHYCNVHTNAIAVEDEDHCEDWTQRKDLA